VQLEVDGRWIVPCVRDHFLHYGTQNAFLLPDKVPTSIVTVITPQGRSSSSFAFVVSNDPRIPDEVSYKAGYVNPTPPAANFGSARLWGIAIADARAPGQASAQV
jgi:hypothetical protein